MTKEIPKEEYLQAVNSIGNAIGILMQYCSSQDEVIQCLDEAYYELKKMDPKTLEKK